ncbi:MAG: hypothetical protein ACXVP0_18855 [Bacteroidia bacterium]
MLQPAFISNRGRRQLIRWCLLLCLALGTAPLAAQSDSLLKACLNKKNQDALRWKALITSEKYIEKTLNKLQDS